MLGVSDVERVVDYRPNPTTELELHEIWQIDWKRQDDQNLGIEKGVFTILVIFWYFVFNYFIFPNFKT